MPARRRRYDRSPKPKDAQGVADASCGVPFLRLCWAVVALVASVAASAQEQKKQPPPEFSTGYFPPTPTEPGPRADMFAYVDVGVLLVVLALATWFLLRMRSRTAMRALVVFSALYFGFYRLGCVCSIGSIQNAALALGDREYALPLTVGAFLVLPLVFALFVGRVFCGAACPLGAIQDLVTLRPIQTPAALDHALGLVPYIYLGASVLFAWTGAAFVICQYDPFIPFYRLGGPWGMIAFGAGLLLIGTRVGRPYCRYLCPYGVLLRWASALSKWHVRITPSECLHCHLCADECPFGAIHPPTTLAPPANRSAARSSLLRALIATPILIAFFALLGYAASPTLARVHHDVRLAERLWAEEQRRVKGTTDETEAYRQLAQPNGAAYARAVEIRRRFDIGSTLLGVWVGLVFGGKLVTLAVRRRREDYEADRSGCYSCGRCYMACPVEHERLGLITLE
ncbi:MAG: 4Fe-4S binding protein [Armatimonadetes bacterium]|nr:4Fe-4S binding protein [Armatimonadota bacterium]